MAISKIIYKTDAEDTGTVWMDVTQKTVTASTMLNGTTALKNDGTDITGNIASKTSSNLTASGATVTAPAGYYASDASKSVASGTEGTPTATKGTVSNHAVTVTPSVTNTAGYISGGTHTGTGVSVSVSELESGTKEITSNGTGISVSGYSAVDVAVPSSGGNDFIVTLSYNSTSEMWEPDKTYAQISAAYSGGKTIAVMTDEPSADVTADGEMGTNSFSYWVRQYNGGDVESIIEQYYVFDANELVKDGEYTYIIPSGTLSITENGESIDVTEYSSIDVSVSGGGSTGLEYETGTWTPTSDTSRGTISFANTHTDPPMLIIMTDCSQSSCDGNSNLGFSYVDHYRQSGFGMPYGGTVRYGYIGYMYSTTSNGASSSTQIFTTSSDSTTDTSGTNARYWAKSNAFYPGSNSTSRYWRSGRTYKWIAVWKPTT